MKPFKILPFLLSGLLFMAIIACKKETSASLTPGEKQNFATTTGKAEADASTFFDDIFDNAVGVNSTVALGGTGVFGNFYSQAYSAQTTLNSTETNNIQIPHCYSVSTSYPDSPALFPVRVAINFGDSCTAADGRTRSGQIIIVYTGRLVEPGNSATISFLNYYVNHVHIEGSVSLKNTSPQGGRSFRLQVTGGKITRPNGDLLSWDRQMDIVQTAGLETPLIAIDDAFQITGQGSGTIQSNNTLYQWSNIISNPLLKRFSCHYIESGTIQINRGTETIATLDFGQGNCDNQATISIDGQVHEISLD